MMTYPRKAWKLMKLPKEMRKELLRTERRKYEDMTMEEVAAIREEERRVDIRKQIHSKPGKSKNLED